MTLLKRLTGASLAIAVLAMASFTPNTAQAGKLLKVPEADWTGGIVTCRIIEFIIKDWGHKVKRVTMPAGPAVYEAVRSGDLAYSCESWPSYSPTKDKYLTKWGGDGSIAYLGEVGVVGQSGYYVPRYVIEGDEARGIKASAPDLKTWEDLNKYKKVFQTMETGDKGRLIACPVAAWLCKDAERLAALKLEYHPLELGSETAHWAEIQSAYKRGEPILAYAWEPHWIHAALDLVEVKLPEHSDAKWPGTDWPQDLTFNYGNHDFVKDNPRVAQLIKNMNLTNSEQAKMIYQVDVKKRKLDDVVHEWMTNNEAIWKAWVPGES